PLEAALLWRLQFWRVAPVVDVGCGVGLTSFPKHIVSFGTWCELRRSFPCFLCEQRETIFERLCLFEMTPPWHGRCSPFGKGGAGPVSRSRIKATGPAVMAD